MDLPIASVFMRKTPPIGGGAMEPIRFGQLYAAGKPSNWRRVAASGAGR